METICAPLAFPGFYVPGTHSAGEETPAPSNPALCVIFIGLGKTIHQLIKISVCAFIIHKTVLHFVKSMQTYSGESTVARLQQTKQGGLQLSRFSWFGSDGIKTKVCAEEGMLHQLCADQIKMLTVILEWLAFHRGVIRIY